jgi:hypothetical protein
MSRDNKAQKDLKGRLISVGQRLAERELAHTVPLDEARRRALAIHENIADAVTAYNLEVESAGVPQLRIEQGPIRPDEKHLRSVQFDIKRGRHTAIVTVKSRGEITLVGPFRAGKSEGPCKSFPFESPAELSSALAPFLESFLEEAATP